MKKRLKYKISGREKPSRKELDTLAREACYARDGHRSVLSGRTENLNPCHIYPKGRYTRMRWDIDNLITLTWNEHLNWWHKNPIEASAWFKEKYPERAKYLKLRVQVQDKSKQDFNAIKLYLKSLIAKYENQ